MDKKLIIRLGVMLVTFVNLILTSSGVNPIPVSETEAYNILSFAAAAASSIYNMWKNNNFTPAAKAGQKVIDAIKSGTLSAEKVETLLSDNM